MLDTEDDGPDGVDLDDDEGSGYSVELEFEEYVCRELFDDPKHNEGAYANAFTARLFFRALEIGVLTGTLIRGGLLVRDQMSLIDDLDNLSHSLSELATTIFDPDTNHYKDSFVALTDANGCDVLFLEKLTLREKYRGRRLGLALMQHVLRYCPHDVAVIKPYPLQHEGTRDNVPNPAFAAFQGIKIGPATTKLRKYYGTLGFKRFGTTAYMARSAAENYPFIDFEPGVVKPSASDR